MSLLKYKATLKKWDLSDNPFRSNPLERMLPTA